MWLHLKVMKRSRTSQFRVVSYPPKSEVDIICDNIIDNIDMSNLRDINFDKLSKHE